MRNKIKRVVVTTVLACMLLTVKHVSSDAGISLCGYWLDDIYELK